MQGQPQFPSLEGWEPTRDTLHGYVQAISAVPRALLTPHPKWWHISLKVQPEGASTDRIPFPSAPSEHFWLTLNLLSHSTEIRTSQGELRGLSMLEGLTTAAFGDRLLGELRELGIEAEVERDRFSDRSPTTYDPDRAGAYRQALWSVNQVLVEHRRALSAETGPAQLWPHNFDLALEWFGSKLVTRQENGEHKEYPAQINFGFAPGDSSHPAPYFYSNPWPFSEEFTQHPLPSGARWFTESWKGSLLPYAELPEPGVDKLLEYFRTIYELASPQLTL